MIKQIRLGMLAVAAAAARDMLGFKSDLIGLAQKISGEVRLQLRRFATGNGGGAPYGGTGPA